MKFSIRAISAALVLSAVATKATWLDKPSLVTYWGQDSKNGVNTQLPLASYCDNNSDVIIISFTLGFKNGNLPTLDLAGTCYSPNFPGTKLLSCPAVGADIKTCQKKGKTILMSLGGADGQYGFANNSDGQAFADTLWNIYGGGTSNTRPFGDAVLDGFDLDIEGGGPTGYAAMVTRLRSHFATDTSKRYYITGAPECPFPDAIMGKVIDAVGFDALHVQFYNNYCSATSSSFNFATWVNWAKNTSPNKNVKILLGLPGSTKAAENGYVTFAKLQPIVQNLYKTYPDTFSGVMIWDASEVYANKDVSPNYATAVAGLVHGLGGGTTTTATKTSTTTSKATTTTTTKTSTTTSKATTTTTTKTSTTTTTTTKSSTTSKSTTTASSTKTSTATTPTATPGSCPVNNSACAVNGQLTCSGDSFATCSNNVWILRKCTSGNICFSTTDGSSIYCAQGTGSTCPSSASIAATESFGTFNVGPAAMPYNSTDVIAQLSVTNTNSTGFQAIINARRLDTNTFAELVTVRFKVASNVKVTGVNNGAVVQKGNNVKIRFQQDSTTTTPAKAIIINIEGQINSGVFTAPNTDTLSFA